MKRWSILETGHRLSRSRFRLSSVCPCKQNTAKGKEAFQGKFVVIVEGFARLLFLVKPLFLPVPSRLQL